MNVYFTPKFIRRSKSLTKKNKHLKGILEKQITLFKLNSTHPSLKLHRLKGKRSKQLAVWVKGDLRALCVKEKNDYVFFDLVSHNEY